MVLAASTRQSFACTWKIDPASARMADVTSTCCQIMWLGSKLQPMTFGAISRSRSIDSGLYATKLGCISMATRTPDDFASFAACFQYGVTRSRHCHWSIFENSGGHGETIQFG